MARHLTEMAAELATWSLNYQARDCDIYGVRQHGRLSDRAAFLDDLVNRLDELADDLLSLPRLS